MSEKKTRAPRPKPPKTIPQPAAPEADPRALCSIVGIGASAGGLEAFKELLEHLPPDTGAAYVLVQHLDPKHVSVLGEILSGSTRMPVLQVTDHMDVLPDHVYVIPPNVTLRLAGTSFVLSERPPNVPHMAIDDFFRSLAEQEGNRAIAVLLSGNGPDGTLGMKAIKGSGGITIVQDESAKYDAMPRNALTAGWADMALPPPGIAHEIVRLCHQPYVSQSGPPASGVLSDAEDEKSSFEIFNLLRSATGVDFALYKHGTLRRRIQRRMALHKLDSEEQYARRLKEDRAELKALFHDILISVTGFFRENATFDALKKAVFPAIFQDRSPQNPVRVWVPGCSTGEDAYSVAICLLEYMRDANIEVGLQIFGTDLSEPALDRARIGVYPESIASEVSAPRLRRFFVKVDGKYQISRAVRDLCIFAQQNLTKDPPFSKLDLILCRNVLIYLGPALQNRIMRFFHYGLKPSGFLVLGLSETVGSSSDLFFPIDRRVKVYSRRGVAPPIALEFGPYESRLDSSARQSANIAGAELQRRVDKFLLNRYSPAGVLIDRDLNVLQLHGHTSPYLEHGDGQPQLNLNRMLREDFALTFRRVFDRVLKKEAPAKSDPISFLHLEKIHNVRISITPMALSGGTLHHYLVLFEEYPPAPRKEQQKPAPAGIKPTKHVQKVRDLEAELAATKHYLDSVIEEHQATTEELKSANEEIQSSNEELQSTNEELLTAKEELQSTNEELTTVNEEMHCRNAELGQINNDLSNLLSSVNIPIVMVGNDLRIRRFTPQAEHILNLLASDVGRPIGDFKPKIDIPDLDRIFLDVIESLRVREREVQDRDGRWYSMWVRPYRTADNRIDGAVMVLVDVTERKYAAEARYRRLFEAAPDGILIVDAESGEIIDLNPFFARTLSVSRPDSVGVRYWELDVFKGTSLDEQSFHDLQEGEFIQRTIAISTRTGGRPVMEVVGNLYLEGERRVIQLNIRDVSERKRGEESSQYSREQQSQRLEMIARLAGGLAHDFNNLLTTVLTQTELMQRRIGAGVPIGGELELIGRSIERATRLSRQFRILGEPDTLEPEIVNLNELITGLEHIMRAALSDAIRLQLELDPAVRLARVDRAHVEHLLLNLALNARSAMHQGGSLRVVTGNISVSPGPQRDHPSVPPGEYVGLEISDHPAATEKEANGLFLQPFFSPRPSSQNGGVPLSSTYNKLLQMGGFVSASSDLGRGSTLRVLLPPAEAPPTDTQAPEAPLPQGHETILLAEHDSMLRDVMARLLQDFGYTVLQAADSDQAVAAVKENAGRINLIITDVLLPPLSGYTLSQRVADLSPQTRVLFMSGPAEGMLVDQPVPGISQFLVQKPFRAGTLARRVREILEQ